MLKQILRDMYVDPEILAGLDDTQKQTLFCKMREEQIRRWRIWDQQQIQHKSIDTDLKKRRVQFRHDENDEPWVWVMGEHPDDRTIEEILADEAKQTARQLAEIETKELRKSYEAELSDIITYEPIPKINDHHHMQTDEIIDDLEIYCSVDELRDRINNANTYASPKSTTNMKQFQNIYNSRISNFNLTCIQPEQPADILKEISNKPSQKVSARILLWEKRMIGEKTNEIYRRLQKKQQETVKEVEEAAKKHEALWQEQERKAKEAENQIREIARRAREEHRKSVNIEQTTAGDVVECSSQMISSSPPSSLDSNISRPSSQDAVVKWYRNEEFHRNSCIDMKTGKPYQWFYGLVSRNDAEQMLSSELSGTFLVRLSEKIWGYAISYKDNDRCKHYLVDASTGKYKFLGPNQLSHNTLGKCKK